MGGTERKRLILPLENVNQTNVRANGPILVPKAWQATWALGTKIRIPQISVQWACLEKHWTLHKAKAPPYSLQWRKHRARKDNGEPISDA